MLKQPKTADRIRLRFNLVLTLCLMGCAPELLGSTVQPCVVDSYADYVAQGQCSLGEFVLKGFTFTSSATGGAILLAPSEIRVDPTGSTPTDISLQFSGSFTAGAGETAEYIFHYNLDPVAPMIIGPTIDLSPNDPVTLTGEFCGDGTLLSPPKAVPVVCQGTAPTGIFPLRLQIVGTGQPPQGANFPRLVTTMDSRLILDLVGPANVTDFGWDARVTAGGPTAVPEPSTSLLLIPALLATPWLRKKWLARS